MPQKIKETFNFVEVETPQQPIIKPKRIITDEQREHLNRIRVLALEKKKQLKEITLKSKLAKTIPKENLAKQYDEYIKQQYQPPPQQYQPPPQQYKQQPIKEKKKIKKIIVQESSEESSEEEIVYIKAKPKAPKQPPPPQQQPPQPQPPPPQPSYNELLYKSSQEQLQARAHDERIKQSIFNYQSLMMPQQY
jgi:hypothetical protein